MRIIRPWRIHLLKSWLAFAIRTPNPYRHFGVIDFNESLPPSSAVKEYLRSLLTQTAFSQSFLHRVEQELGWQRLRSIVENRGPKSVKVQRGDFGEVLAVAALEQFHGYVIPVPKLRYKITADQTQPSTDALALRVNQNRIVEVCFVESKLRTTSSPTCAVEGYTQLYRDYGKEFPDILIFTAQRLQELGHLLNDPFFEYLSRREEKQIDSFSLHLCWEAGAWSESVLQNLEELPPQLKDLSLRVTLVKGLGQLTDDLFRSLGATTIEDD